MNFSGLSYGEIGTISSTLKSKSESMNSLLEEIKGIMNKVGQDDVWSGTSASATKETFDKLSAKFPEFYEAISDCSKYLDKVVETYKNVDSKVTGQ